MRVESNKKIISEFYCDELLEKTSDGYDPYGYIDDNMVDSRPDSPRGEVVDFDWEEG